MQYDYIRQEIIDTIFPIHFPGDNTSTKIGDVIPFSKRITQDIMYRFGIKSLDCDTSSLSTDELCDVIYESKNPKTSKKHVLNRHQIFAIVLSTFSSLVGRDVSREEHIGRLKTEFLDHKGGLFEQKLIKLLQDAFNENIEIEIDFQTNPKLTVYNFANQITYALVKCGRAVDPKKECTNMDSFWAPIWMATTFDSLVYNLDKALGVWTSTKTISTLRSYEEFEEYVTKRIIKSKLEGIVLGHDAPRNEKSPSDIFISACDKEYIKRNVQNIFNITVGYDISGTRLSQLYTYIYKKIKYSVELQDKLFGFQHKEEQPILSPNKKTEEVTRNQIFVNIIRNINHAVCLGHSVQTYTYINTLMSRIKDTPKKTTRLQNAFKEIENKYNIKIDLSNQFLTVRDICNAAHDSFIEQGKSKSIYVAIEDMHPLWAAINKSLDFGFLKSILRNEYNIKQTVYNLSNCRTFDDYKRLIVNTKLNEKRK